MLHIASTVQTFSDASFAEGCFQVEVEQEYIAQGKKLHEEAKGREEDTMSQEFGITSARYRSDKDDSEFFTQLYRKVFTFVASGPGMEAALTDPEVRRRTPAECGFPRWFHLAVFLDAVGAIENSLRESLFLHVGVPRFPEAAYRFVFVGDASQHFLYQRVNCISTRY